MNNTEIKLGDIYRKIRLSKGLTQEYVAEKLDLCSRYVSDLERDKSLGGISTLVKLCNLYQVTPTIILNDYLDLSEDIKIDPNLSGYYSLSSEKKKIVLKLIEFLNSTTLDND